MQVLEYDRPLLASRILSSINLMAISSSPAPSAYFSQKRNIAAGGYDNTSMGKIWSWWSSCMSSAGRAAAATAFVMLPTPSAGPRCRKGWETCADSGAVGILGCSIHDETSQHYGQPQAWGGQLYLTSISCCMSSFPPILRSFGLLTTLLAFAVDLINVPFMLLFSASMWPIPPSSLSRPFGPGSTH